MHALGDGKGIVARALLPGAQSVSVRPVHEPSLPAFELRRIKDTALFEGIAKKADRVYAYDLVARYPDGHEHVSRDPYSFLPTLGEQDMYLFGQGTEQRIHEKLGAHLRELDGVPGTSFAVWAPNASRISVVGTFNDWDGRRHMMRRLGASGVWEIFVPGVGKGAHYKFEILDAHGQIGLKTDPYGTYFETPPKNAAIVWPVDDYSWGDGAWLERRASMRPLNAPISIYEVHLGSWMRPNHHESYSYRDLAGRLIDYVRKLGFTHVEFLPVAEHAFYPSWGYQVTGFYAPSSRYGSPEDFQFLVDSLHDAGIGVIVDWVPAHFPRDTWALARFDGTALYEHEDPRKGAHQDWGTLIFNFGRHEVRNFLTANALFWCERYHIDGLRVDAVASMLYLDYSRKAGEWIPNQYGGRENLEAVDLMREFNHLVHVNHPGVMTIAEESTAWPQVSRPPYVGGLGFTLKWNMGWMHDTLNYFKREPVHRRFHQNELTFAMLYHYHENFVLPLSHDEVVHGKGSLLARMPGDDWQRFANLRCLLAYQWCFPGKKLMFMGGEFGQSREWNCNAALDWSLLEAGPYHAGLQRLVADLNAAVTAHPALHEADFEESGFSWVDCSDHEQSVLSFLRRNLDASEVMIVILNLTPVLRESYRIGLPADGYWREVINTDAGIYGGSNQGNMGGLQAEKVSSHGHECSAVFRLPPLAVSVFRREVGAS
ncbi:MAG TPA: 1,4-alpha-glucan branching enzyme [Verrucomicrobiales bacterium]|nr:1,4-alpha-glucan branching enzyme [Verrucomicrobiales bacterium]